MKMKERDIKLLWGKAACRCSICKIPLSPIEAGDFIVGEMAHIIAKSPEGPRGDVFVSDDERNSYANLILLCPTHHTLIDKDRKNWTVERLRKTKQDHEQWVEQKLRSGELQPPAEKVLRKIDRLIERSRSLHALLWTDIGNARFLNVLHDSEDWLWYKLNVGKTFRDYFLDMLEITFGDPNADSPPFGFEMLDALVAFPDGFETYAPKFRNPPLERSNIPVLIQNVHLVRENNQYFIEGGNRMLLPNLPTRNGFITSIDAASSLPNSVGEEPSEDYWGAYYWVRPVGLRIVVMGIGVLDPLEAQYGTAIWWSPDQKSPLLGVRPAKIATEQLKQQMYDAIVRNYKEHMRKYRGQDK